jgi:hypothetical protein
VKKKAPETGLLDLSDPLFRGLGIRVWDYTNKAKSLHYILLGTPWGIYFYSPIFSVKTTTDNVHGETI